MASLTRLIKKSTLTAKFGAIVLLVWVLCAIFADVLSPYDPTVGDLSKRLLPPSWCEKGVSEHVLGTDEMGRDVLSRLINGTRISLVVGVVAVIVSLIIGTTLGLIAGYYGGIIDTIVMRAVDVMLAFPFIFFALCLMAVLGSSLRNIIIVLGVTGWVPYARTIRANVLVLRKREFVVASTSLGCTSLRNIVKHILQNVLDRAIVLGTLEMATSIISEASLTFLGMGVPPSIPSWGQMLATGREYIFNAWWLTTFPGIAVFLVCLSINFVGDWVRDIRDPRLKNE